jgi:hypothetical protein
MIYATTPFKGKERNDTFNNIRLLPIYFRDAPRISYHCKDCVTQLLEKKERKRLGSRSGASEVKQHKWFAKINWGLLRNTRPPIIPSLSAGHDTINFRQMRESQSLHLEEQTECGGPYSAPGTPGLSVDDGLDCESGDLFGAFSSVTLHYDGET